MFRASGASKAGSMAGSWVCTCACVPLLYRVNMVQLYVLGPRIPSRHVGRCARDCAREPPAIPASFAAHAAAGVLCVRCRTHGGCMHFRLDTSLKTFLRGLGGEDVGRDVRSRSGRKTSLGPPACPNRPSACNRSLNKRNGSGRPSVLKRTGAEQTCDPTSGRSTWWRVSWTALPLSTLRAPPVPVSHLGNYLPTSFLRPRKPGLPRAELRRHQP